MKAVTFTAMMAILVAFPLILKRRHLRLARKAGTWKFATDQDRRYAIDDFLT